MHEKHADDNAKVYLVGGGIASLAAAAFLIRDGDIPGHNITILEESTLPELLKMATSCAAAE